MRALRKICKNATAKLMSNRSNSAAVAGSGSASASVDGSADGALLITQMRSAGLVVLGRDFGLMFVRPTPRRTAAPPFINIILIWVSETNGR